VYLLISCIGVCDYGLRCSDTSNILDYSVDSHQAIPRILGDFANQCVAAAQQDTKYCPLAINSLNATDPGASVLQRINNVINTLSNQTYTDPKSHEIVSIYSMAWTIRGGLMDTESFPAVAQAFLDAETLIQNQIPTNSINEAALIDGQPSNDTTNLFAKRDTGNVSVLTTSTWNPRDPLTGNSNAFVFPAVNCLDAHYNGIDNVTSFVNYLSPLIAKDGLTAYFGLSSATCLAWPNLTNYDVERVVAKDFPSKLPNKMLVIGVTDDPVTPYHSAQATYNLIGSDNANFMTHDGSGHCTTSDPNNCTWSALQSYFVNGISWT